MRRALDRFRRRVAGRLELLLHRLGLELRELPCEADGLFGFTIAHLLAMELARGERPTVVQVGANDGLTDDPLHELIVGRSLRGLLIEPQPAAFGRLRENYAGHDNLVLLNVAIGPRDGVARMYGMAAHKVAELPVGERVRADQIASLDPEHLMKMLAPLSSRPQECIESFEVPMLTFASALERAGLDRVDVLLIDVEGADAMVLGAVLDAGHRPRILGFEHSHLPRRQRRAAWGRLRALGYSLTTAGADTLAVLAADDA